LEVLLGLEESERIPLGFEGSYLKALEGKSGSSSPALERVRRQLDDGPTLKHTLEEWLVRTPIDGVGAGEPGAEEALDTFVRAYQAAHASEVDRTAAGALEHADSDADRERLERRFAAEKQALVGFLAGDEADGGAHRRRVRASLLFLLAYKDLPLLAWPATLVEALIELEQAFTVFRQRHARMVERVIGRRTGTGGSAGVDYLDQTALEYRVYRDVWAVRTFQIRPEANPALERASFYGFRNG
jgi:tryptophan 2,3-dioxygenase